MSASMSEETWIEILLAFDALKMEEKHVSIKKKFARALKGNGAYEYIDNACVYCQRERGVFCGVVLVRMMCFRSESVQLMGNGMYIIMYISLC